MGIIAISLLIIGIFNLIACSLIVNHYKRNPEKGWDWVVVSLPFLYGIVFIICAITGYIWLPIPFIFVSGIIFRIHTARKYPELKKRRERYKQSPFYRISRILSYILLGFAILLILFILVVVLFNITF